jgi:hypothetical protein
MGVLSFARGGILGYGKTSNMLSGNPVATGDFELIQTVFGTGSSTTVTFSSIPQNYKHLQIRYVGKNTVGSDNINLTMNGISSGVYVAHRLWGNGTAVAVTPSGTASSAFLLLSDAISVSATANSFGAGIIDILDYSSTTKNKTVKIISGVSDSTPSVQIGSGLYAQTTAVSSLTLTVPSGFLTDLSRFSLYGIRG